MLSIKNFSGYRNVIEYVSEFGKGSAKEGVMSDYSYIVRSKPKTVNGVEVIKSGKVVYCDYADIPKLITQNHNQIIKLNRLNNAED